MPSAKDELSPRVIHIPRTDEAGTHVLLHVSRADSAALELKITATEGEYPYTATVRQSQLKKIRAKNYQGSEDEWKDIVLHVLGLLDDPGKKSELLAGIEASASVNATEDEGKEMVIAVRKRIETITQRLGFITLNQDDEQAIELFEWSNIAIARADTLERRFNSLLDSHRAAQDTIIQLNKQLEEFISSKNQHEEQLMTNFVQILNEKKLKIRNQQRLLASAKVDPENLSMMQAATATDRSKSGKKGRAPKRSAKHIGEDESESDDGFEKMDVEKSRQQAADELNDETDDEGRSTPQPLEDEENTTADEEELSSPPAQPAPPAKDSGNENQKGQGPSDRVVAKSPPPRRELPFARKLQKASAPVPSPPAEKDPDETGGETDDDEL